MANFERPVLGCIDADFCKYITVRKLLTRSTRCTFGDAPLRTQSLQICSLLYNLLTIFRIFPNYVNASIPKEKTGALSFFESFILMQRLTVLSVIIHETTAHVMSSFDPLHALGLLVCIQRYPCRTRGFCFLHLF